MPLISAILAGLLIFVMAMTSLMGPGVRHAHEDGDASHSHSTTAHAHSHPYGTHSHSHAHGFGHSHSHGAKVHSHFHRHGSDADLAEDSSESADAGVAHSHIHVQFLWFELTLPDWFGGDAAVSVASDADGVSEEHRNSVNGNVVSISSPFTLTQLVQVLILSVGPVPERTRLPVPLGRIRLLSKIAALHQRLPDDVLVPPPELS